MKFEEQHIKGVWVIEPKVFNDSRGYFAETYKQEEFEKHIGKVSFVQDNESKSGKGVLRGLHYQIGEHAQAKLVRVIQGAVLDVAVDIRKDSSTYGQYVAVELSGENKKQLFVPRGFAHGFVVLSDSVIFTYKVDNLYSPQNERTILWSDPHVNVQWGVDEKDLNLSDKDKLGKPFSEVIVY